MASVDPIPRHPDDRAAPGCHVLIIEDEPLIARNIEAMMEDEGTAACTIATTEHGAVHMALVNPPQLIISDVQLALGTGPAAVAEIQRRLGQMPVVYISGSIDQPQAGDAATIMLGKPFTASQLCTAVRRLIDLRHCRLAAATLQ